MKFWNKKSVEGGQRHGFMHSLGHILFIAAVFLLGVGIGQGKIVLGSPRYSSENANLPAKLNYSSVDQVYSSLKENYDGKITEGQLEDGLKHGLASAAKDPYTVFFTAKEASDFNSNLNQTLTGIGAMLELDVDKNVVVQSPVPGSPAEKAGLLAKDIITQVDGKSTEGKSLSEVVSKIRGKKGTTVKLEVVRNKANLVELAIVRDNIVVPSVITKKLDNNIGYIQITSFSETTNEQARKAAEQFKADDVKGIVLDLRNNGGGYLDGAVGVSSLWLPAGKNVLQEKRGNKVVQSYSALGGNVLNGIPTVVLINGGSASASEIAAGALHDNNAAYLIGEKSFGKGVVQQLINFSDGSQLKVTVASWYRPNGQNINHKGITPDQVIKITEADAKAQNDTQLKAAEAYLTK